MRTLLHWVITAFALAMCNGLIWQKNAVVTGGTKMLLRLAPRDPRSLMQGDYMALNYEISRQLPADDTTRRGKIVVRLDADGVASFVRMDRGEPLAPGEMFLQFRRGRSVRLGAESFFFQEGTADICFDGKVRRTAGRRQRLQRADRFAGRKTRSIGREALTRESPHRSAYGPFSVTGSQVCIHQGFRGVGRSGFEPLKA